MQEKGYCLKHTTTIINITSTNVTNIEVVCTERITLNFTRTYYTYNITTDMIDDMIEEDTIDECNNLTFRQAVGLRVIVYSFALMCLLIILYNIHLFYVLRMDIAKERSLRRRKVNRLQPPSYAELSRDYPTPPNFEDLAPPSFEDLQVDIRTSQPEVRKSNEWGCGLVTGFVMLCLTLWFMTFIKSEEDFPKERLQDVQNNTTCTQFCFGLSIHAFSSN